MASGSRSGPVPLIPPSKLLPGKPPPLPPPPPPPPNTAGAGIVRKRTSHACDRCRVMRTKCSGGTRCTRCTKDDAVCVYADHKREKNKKDLADSATRIKELEDENATLLAALRQLASVSDLQASVDGDVLGLLKKHANEETAESSGGSRSQSRSVKSPTTNMSIKVEERGEQKVSSDIGSPGHQGELRRVINLDQGTGASGFVGKMSEMSWMQRCREYLVNEPTVSAMDVHLPELDQHASAAEGLTYFMDDTNLLAVDEDHVDAMQWPSFNSAVILTEASFHATEGAFELLSHEEFVENLYSFHQNNLIPSWAQRRWMALANLVWAIGSRWLHLAKLNRPGATESHLVYYARARALGLDHRISFDRPDVETVQGMGLLAFYLLINGSISRAWNTIGNAVRNAMALGLHLKISDPLISARDQGRRTRTWYSLYSLEILIAEITGRPHFARTAHVTVPLEMTEDAVHDPMLVTPDVAHYETSVLVQQAWLNFLSTAPGTSASMHSGIIGIAAPPNLSLPVSRDLFLYQVRLCQISEDVAEQLYTGRRQEVPWAETQRTIAELQESLDAWKFTLPDELKPSRLGWVHGSPRANIQLAMYSCSVSMILHRPCLCEIYIEDESEKSKGFNLESARTCVRAAIAMLEILPDEFVAHKVYQALPWWTLLHYLCQSASVLLLELCLDAQHFQGESGQIMTGMWKAMSYLARMSEDSMSAFKACRIFHSLLQKVSVRYGESNLSEMSQHAIRPEGWTEVEENDLRVALDHG